MKLNHISRRGLSVFILSVMVFLIAQTFSIAAKILTKEQQEELRQLILSWRKNNPDKVVYNYLRFSDFAAQRRDSTSRQKALNLEHPPAMHGAFGWC